MPPASAGEEPPQPKKGGRISLEDLAGAGEPPPKEPPQPQKGSRISLEDLAGAGEPPPKEPPQPQKGSRISLEDLAGESPSAAPEADTLQNDLAQLRQSLEEPEEKRGLFGRKKKKK
jgi:hypothetical protein